MKIKNNVNSGFKGKLEDFNDLQPVGFKAPYHSEITKKSILERGFVQPFAMCEINGDLFICDGHLRKDLIYELINDGHQVPEEFSYYLIDVNNDRKKAIDILFSFNTKTNPIDLEVLTEWVNIEQVEVEVTSLNVVDLTDIEEETEVLEAEEDDFDSTPPETPITVLGDLFEIGEHRLLCGDSTDSDAVAKLMDGEKADMVFTDPPYGVDYEGGTGRYANGEIKARTSTKIKNDLQANLYKEINPIINLFLNEGAIYIWYADKFIKEVIEVAEGFELRTIINWYKINQGFGDMGSNYHSVSEPCLYLVKGKANFVGANNEKNVWELQRPQKNNLHPTQKPVELPEKAIQNSSKENQKVLDLFLGSGSTMVAAHQLKRKCYGMELDPKYCDVIVKRMIKLDPKLKVKRNGIDETKKWLDKL